MTGPSDALLRQIQETHAGDPWYGSSRLRLLEGLTPAQASAHPIPGGHSIWELVLHMTSWTLEVTRRLGGAAPGNPAEGDWPAVGPVSPQTWQAALVGLGQAHEQLLAAARALPEARWSDPVGESRDPALGTGVDVAGTLVGLAQHDAYHIGQIAVVKQALS